VPATQDGETGFHITQKGTRQMEIVQSVTSNRSDIPVHYIPISSYGCHKGNTDKKASEEYKLLYRAWCDEEIGGIKFMANPHDKRGKIFVDPADAGRLIDAMRRPKRPPSVEARNAAASVERSATVGQSQIESALIALCEINNGLTLMQATLERLATAAESIATQPKTTQQELLHSMDSNGFYS
jgi:hypothetical protein